MPLSGSARVLVMVEQPLIVEVIKLTLNHGVYVTREAKDVAEATAVLGEWQPHLAVIDMDIGGDVLMQRMAPRGGGRPDSDPGPGADAARGSEDQAGGLRAGRRRHHDDPVLARGAARPRAGHHAPRPRRIGAVQPGPEARGARDRHPAPPGPGRVIRAAPDRARAEPALPPGGQMPARW